MKKENSRLKNSVYNSLANFLLRISTTIFSFIVRTVFIRILGEQLLGLDGLLTNILSLLSLADLGISTAISFSLYNPLSKKDNKKISELIIFIKKVYQKIALFILIIGILLLPFLKYMIKDYTGIDNIYLIYILYLINTVSSYFVSYSAILIEADQKNYKLSKIIFSFDIITYGSQLLVLIFLKNFILYLIVQFVARFIQRVITNRYIQKTYTNVNFKEAKKIDEKEKKTIITNVKGLLYHKVGDYAVNSTDNILISSIVNIATTGLYYNYLSLMSVLQGFVSAVITAPTSSFGNLNVEGDDNSKHNVFKLINYICFFITGISVVGFYFCINKFITLWIGEKFLLSNVCVILISLNLYLSCIVMPLATIKNSTGLYYQDRFVPILQAIVNLVVSIVAGINWGLVGILLGTTISYITIAITLKPYYIYKNIFKSSPLNYYLQVLKNILLLIASSLLAQFILNYISIPNVLLEMIIYGIISCLIFFIVFILATYKSYEYSYYKNLIINYLKRKK